MTDASSTAAPVELTVAMKSRLIRAIHYEPANNRLCVLTTHGRMHIHEGVAAHVVETIANNDHPGHAYLSMKSELGPKTPSYSIAGTITRMRAMRAIRQVLN